MESTGRLLINIGFFVVAVGILLFLGSKFGFERIPGDFSFKLGNVKIFVPLGTCILVSVLLTLILRWFRR